MNISNKLTRNDKDRIHSIHSVPINPHLHQLYLLEQHSEIFKIWLPSIKTNAQGKSLVCNWAQILFIPLPLCTNTCSFEIE